MSALRKVVGNAQFLEDDVHRCEFANVLPTGFEWEVVLGMDFVLDRGLFCQSGIQTSFGSGRLEARTYVLPLVLKEGARH
jgi:hypothetical protein